MPTGCHVCWSMGLDCFELSQVAGGQKVPSRKSREGCILVPHSDDYFIVLGDWGHRQLLWHPELSELKVRVLTLTQVPEGGGQGGHDPPPPPANRTRKAA